MYTFRAIFSTYLGPPPANERGRAPEREGASERARPPSTNYRDSETSGLKLAFGGRGRLFGANFS